MHCSVETRDQANARVSIKSIRGLNNTIMREGSPSHPQQEHGPITYTSHACVVDLVFSVFSLCPTFENSTAHVPIQEHHAVRQRGD